MQLGIFSKTYPAGTVPHIFSRIRDHGLTLVHYNMSTSGLGSFPEHISDEHSQEVLRAAAENELQIIGLSATFNMIHPDPIARQEGIESCKILAEAAPRIGTHYLSLCTGSRNWEDRWAWHPDNARPEAWQDLLKSMEQVLMIAEKHDLSLGVELEMGNVIRNARLARKLLDEMQSERLQIILDPANLFDTALSVSTINDLIQEAIDLLHAEITVAHAKDRTLDGQFCAAGKGDVDFDFFVAQLRQMDFEGPLVLHGLAEEEVSGSVSLLKKLL
jgi:sugar phosphate isomerase/epimerase